MQGGYSTGKTGNLVLTFPRPGKHRELLLEKFGVKEKIFNCKSLTYKVFC